MSANIHRRQEAIQQLLSLILGLSFCATVLSASTCRSADPLETFSEDTWVVEEETFASFPERESTLGVDCSNNVQLPTEIWELSTRHMPDRFSCINVLDPNFDVHRFQEGCWKKGDVEQATRHDPAIPLTIVYVHGNFMERCNARERVRIVDRYLRAKTSVPYRLIMLSWPSQRGRKPLRDVVDNAASAECQSLYFAWILDRLRGEQIGILGFSYGARAVTGGLHLQSGGHIPGLCYVPATSVSQPIASPRYHVGVVAPAIDRNWLTSHGRHGHAMDHVDAMVNLYNSRDPILRRFRFLDRLSRPVAAGFAGFTGIELFSNPRSVSPLSSQPRVQQFDCGSLIGTTHSERSYYGNCPHFANVIDNILWNNP